MCFEVGFHFIPSCTYIGACVSLQLVKSYNCEQVRTCFERDSSAGAPWVYNEMEAECNLLN